MSVENVTRFVQGIRWRCKYCAKDVTPFLIINNEDGVSVKITMRCDTCNRDIAVAVITDV